MHGLRLNTIVLICGGLIASYGPLARAGDSPLTAETLIQQGLELRRLGNDDGALPKFQHAFKLEPTPKHTAQLGLCEQAVGRWADAEKHLTAAIEQRADAWVAKYIKVLRESLEAAKANVGRLEFSGAPAGAALTVNGSYIGTFPYGQPVKVNAGQVYISVTATGYSRWVSSLNVPGAHLQQVVVEMTKEAPQNLAVKIPAVTTQAQATAEDSSKSLVPPMPASGVVEAKSDRSSVLGTWWFWTGAATLVAGAVVTALILSGGSSSEPTCPVGVDVCGPR